jgi:hypothetical protein
LKRFVDWLAERESDPRIYARFAAAAITPRSTLQDVREYDLPWGKVKQGFFDLARDKRLTTANMHQFCWLATAYQDRPTAKLLFDALSSEGGGVWQSVENYTQARDWANGKIEHFTYQIPEDLLKPVKQ